MDLTAHPAVGRATSLIDLNRAEEALPLLAQAIASDPEDPRARGLLALALIRADRYEEAVAAAEEAVRVAPDAEWGYRLLSIARLRTNRPLGAVEAAAHAVALEPELAEGRIALSSALVAANRGREARVEAKRAVELAPEDPAAHAAAGQAALNQRDIVAAMQAFRESLALDPEQPDVQNNLGVILLRLGERAEAMELFEASARNDPRDDVGRRNLAFTARRFVDDSGKAGPIAAIIVLFLAVRFAHFEHISDTAAAIVLVCCLIGVPVLVSVYRRSHERELSPAARALLRDQRRRMRRRPWTWEPTGWWVPWPIALLLTIPAQVVTVLGGLGLVLMLINAGGYGPGDWTFFGVVAALTAFFALRWRDRPERWR